MQVHAIVEYNPHDKTEGKVVHIFTSADKTLPDWVDPNIHVGMDVMAASLDAIQIGTKVVIDESGMVLEYK